MAGRKAASRKSIEAPSVTTESSARRAKAVRSQIVSGSLVLLLGSGLVSVTNLFYNLAIARMLGPAGFAHASVVNTLLLLMSAITLSFQIVCAKLVARQDTPEHKAAVYLGLHRRAWRFGILIGAFLVLMRGPLSSYLNLPNPLLITMLGAGTAFYIPLGARRGCIQGTCDFSTLAWNFIIEGLVRLAGAVLLISIGLGVNGAVMAGMAAVIVAYFFAVPSKGLQFGEGVVVPASFREGLQAIVFFVGQVIINNSDIVLVKHYFPAQDAGIYAAIALVGRVINMCAWSVVSSMFPLSAANTSTGRHDRQVLLTSLGMVLLVVVTAVLGLSLVPDFIWKSAFGAQFEIASYSDMPSLLVLYAISTGIYSLASVVIVYEMSRRIANTGWIQLAFSIALFLGILFFHANLLQVIHVQLTLMLLLLLLVAAPMLYSTHTSAQRIPETYRHLGKLTSLREQEVIAEFLQSELHHPEFDSYRGKLGTLVSDPDLDNPAENYLRRELLFLRRGAMWRELPRDTRWFEVRLSQDDLQRVRVFPRAHWRKFARGDFYLDSIVETIRGMSATSPTKDWFLRKLHLLGGEIRKGLANPTIILIGLDEASPLTILDGNHRIAAAMLVTPESVHEEFRFICGFSSRMNRCCWYQTSLTTLIRYAGNLVRHVQLNPGAQLNRLLQSKP
jgi:O-antigen/teichoic acid export membrane protein